MGFKALNQAGEAVYSFNLDVNEWANLKTTHNKQLKMSCCDAVAIPKTSAKGTPFFAHHTQGNCNHKPESIEHLFCKYLLILSLKDQGWNAETEVPGRTPSGEKWIADVYATKGKSKIIFEVQWSGITLDEITRRNNKYKESGIRCVWLKKAKMKDDWNKQFELLYHSNRELIVFGFEKWESDFYVFGFHKLDDNRRKIFDNRSLSIDFFVKNLLGGRIRLNNSITKNILIKPVLKYYDDCLFCREKIYLHDFSIVLDIGSGINLYTAPNHWLNVTHLMYFQTDKNVSKIINNGPYKGYSAYCYKCGELNQYKNTKSYELEAEKQVLSCEIKPQYIEGVAKMFEVFWVYLGSQD